jgi:OOP family OmpA-OmpF porin
MKSAGSLPILCIALTLGACAQQQTVPPTPVAGPPPAPVAAAPPPAAQGSTEPEALQVYFASKSAKLDPSATEVLDHAARLYREGHPSVMLVAGHADRTGSEFPNIMLSARRADVVKRAMVARGIPASVLEIRADGWTDQPVPNQPGQAEPKDRVAVVTWR